MILTTNEIRILKEGYSNYGSIVALCESHEQLRKERDEMTNRYRSLLRETVDKATIREKQV